jgi:hypothetical protein
MDFLFASVRRIYKGSNEKKQLPRGDLMKQLTNIFNTRKDAITATYLVVLATLIVVQKIAS